MPNLGGQKLKSGTTEGRLCILTMQVTDLHRPLVSALRLCDDRHRVVFMTIGGYIQQEKAGQTTSFYRDNNIYRMDFPTIEPDAGFVWPGK